MFCRIFFLFPALLIFNAAPLYSQTNNVAGQYKAILNHDGTHFYQYALITLRTVNLSGNIQISANVRVFFGESNSNEYITYDFEKVPLNLLTSQISAQNENNDISLVGFLKDGKISGEWFSSLIGFVGSFEAQKTDFPDILEDAVLVTSLSGHYRGTLKNENPDSNLPERLSFSFVTTQDTSLEQPILNVTGKTRLYLGEFGSQEYIELVFNNIQFNYYNRFLTAKTEQYGLTFRGYLNQNGVFEGEVLSDAIGLVGPVKLSKYEK